MGQGQSLLALTVVKNARHECTLQGCNVSLPFGKIKEHEETCNWRLIICPSDGYSCTAMVPFCTVLTHGKNCSACELSPGRRILDNGVEMSSYLKLDTAEAFDGKDMSWKTKILLGQGIVCFVRPSRRGGIFTIDVVMKGSKEECEEFRVTASIYDAVSRKSKFKATFQPRYGFPYIIFKDAMFFNPGLCPTRMKQSIAFQFLRRLFLKCGGKIW